MGRVGTIRQFLAAEHESLDALLSAAVQPSGEIDLVSYASFRAGLLRHIGIEEKILFPASQRANAGSPLPMMARLHRDHGALALLLVPAPTAGIVEEIRSILVGHDEIEEASGGLYDACDRILGAELETVMEKLRTYPPVKVAPHFDGPGVVRRAEDALRAVSRRRASGNETHGSK